MAAKITPNLWFDNNAEEAIAFYQSVFPDFEHLGSMRPADDAPIVAASFKLNGQEFTAINGGPYFKFNESVSFAIDCADQEEVDYYWTKLTDGGEESQCGWLKDRYGLSWQVVPRRLLQLLQDPDRDKANRVMQAMLKMQKIEIPVLEEAANAGE